MVFSDLLGVQLDRIPPEQALLSVENFLQSDTAHYIVTVNPEFLIAAQRHHWFREILNRADLCLLDGIGIQWAMEFFESLPRWLPYMPKKFYRVWLTRWIWVRSQLVFFVTSLRYRRRHTQRVAGSDFITPLLEHLPKGCRIYLVGGQRGVPERVQRLLQKQYPHLEFVGAESGLSRLQWSTEGIQIDPREDSVLSDHIQAQGPTVVLVAFGQGKQEWWISKHLFHFPSVRLFIGVGGSFDFIAGKIPRAPVWVQSVGLEWCWRLFVQPWRIHRIWTAVVRFPRAILRQAHQEIELLASGSAS